MKATAASENESVHEALVSATWDAVAVMNALPKRSVGCVIYIQ